MVIYLIDNIKNVLLMILKCMKQIIASKTTTRQLC